MDFIKNSIHFTNKYIRENILKYFYLVGIVFAVTGVLFFFAIRVLPEESIGELYASIEEAFVAKDVVNDDGRLSFFGIFFNNLRAGALISVLGFIPFLFIPVTCVILNSAIIGIIFAVFDVFTDENLVMMFIKYILPHGIFEIPALIIEGAIGMRICAFLCRKIFGKAKNEKIVDHIKGCVGTFAIYVVPLLVIAAFIEAVVLSALYL